MIRWQRPKNLRIEAAPNSSQLRKPAPIHISFSKVRRTKAISASIASRVGQPPSFETLGIQVSMAVRAIWSGVIKIAELAQSCSGMRDVKMGSAGRRALAVDFAVEINRPRS